MLSRFGGEPDRVIGGAIRDSDLIKNGDQGVVLVSGGADSVALLVGLVSILGPDSLAVLHVNYGLREGADSDESLVRQLCEELQVELAVIQAGKPAGNLQAWAREVRLQAAERIRIDRNSDWIAVGHNRSDQVETMLYRLAASPGSRSLLAMPQRSGHVIRPLLALDRTTIRLSIGEVTAFAEDPTNEDLTFARNRIRHRLIPELERINSAAELNLTKTRAELFEDEEALSQLAKRVVEESRFDPDLGLGADVLAKQPAAVRRRILRHLAEAGLRRPVAITQDLVVQAERLLSEPEGGELDLGGGGKFLIDRGAIRVIESAEAMDQPKLVSPVSFDSEVENLRFGDWAFEIGQVGGTEATSRFGDPWEAFFEVDESPLSWRTCRSGDKIEPLGMEGSKRLQDVFTDARVPASRRALWPVLTAGETIVWIPGLVRSRHLLVVDSDSRVLWLEARPPFAP